MLPLKDQAIKCALDNNWTEAIQINQSILEETPKDIDALNRLGYSYLKCFELKKSKEIFEQVVSYDKTNPIALKNLQSLHPSWLIKGCKEEHQTLSLSLRRCVPHKTARSFCRETEWALRKGRLFQVKFSLK